MSVLVLFALLYAANIPASSAISVAWQKSTFNKSIPLNVILVNGHFELQELFWNLFCGQRFNCLCCCRLFISFQYQLDNDAFKQKGRVRIKEINSSSVCAVCAMHKAHEIVRILFFVLWHLIWWNGDEY